MSKHSRGPIHPACGAEEGDPANESEKSREGTAEGGALLAAVVFAIRFAAGFGTRQ